MIPKGNGLLRVNMAVWRGLKSPSNHGCWEERLCNSFHRRLPYAWNAGLLGLAVTQRYPDFTKKSNAETSGTQIWLQVSALASNKVQEASGKDKIVKKIETSHCTVSEHPQPTMREILPL
jgi:hypothetical protein